jgi:hypothetical protein
VRASHGRRFATSTAFPSTADWQRFKAQQRLDDDFNAAAERVEASHASANLPLGGPVVTAESLMRGPRMFHQRRRDVDAVDSVRLPRVLAMCLRRTLSDFRDAPPGKSGTPAEAVRIRSALELLAAMGASLAGFDNAGYGSSAPALVGAEGDGTRFVAGLLWRELVMFEGVADVASRQLSRMVHQAEADGRGGGAALVTHLFVAGCHLLTDPGEGRLVQIGVVTVIDRALRMLLYPLQTGDSSTQAEALRSPVPDATATRVIADVAIACPIAFRDRETARGALVALEASLSRAAAMPESDEGATSAVFQAAVAALAGGAWIAFAAPHLTQAMRTGSSGVAGTTFDLARELVCTAWRALSALPWDPRGQRSAAAGQRLALEVVRDAAGRAGAVASMKRARAEADSTHIIGVRRDVRLHGHPELLSMCKAAVGRSRPNDVSLAPGAGGAVVAEFAPGLLELRRSLQCTCESASVPVINAGQALRTVEAILATEQFRANWACADPLPRAGGRGDAAGLPETVTFLPPAKQRGRNLLAPDVMLRMAEALQPVALLVHSQKHLPPSRSGPSAAGIRNPSAQLSSRLRGWGAWACVAHGVSLVGCSDVELCRQLLTEVTVATPPGVMPSTHSALTTWYRQVLDDGAAATRALDAGDRGQPSRQ